MLVIWYGFHSAVSVENVRMRAVQTCELQVAAADNYLVRFG